MKKTLLCILISGGVSAQSLIHHNLKVVLDVPGSAFEATDTISIPQEYLKNNHDSLDFYLNGNLTIRSTNAAYKLQEIKSKTEIKTGDIAAKHYLVIYPEKISGNLTLPLSFKGKITDSVHTGAAESARGFSETSGIISNDGVYMAGSTYWVPSFNDDFLSFSLTVETDPAWRVVSQGSRTKNDLVTGKKKEKRITHYEFPDPADEIYLIAAKWTEFDKRAGDTEIQAMLRSADTALAFRYIDVTSGYLDLYNKLIGPYPYSKFTIVENFWETGYGMPSFTLLGPQVIRFPFILNSSYPHELLHNYWGNSVYVNGDLGNWCEGLTAYMADHLIKEQMGQGDEYRRTTLQKFTDFVNENNDFPVKEFTSRHNSAEEAIGYGKTLMIYEMLRYSFGDELFRKAFRKFYQDNKFKKASFYDIEKSFEALSGQNLRPFFEQWLTRKGAPTLALADVSVTADAQQFVLNFKLSQTQKEDPFQLKVPVAIYFEGVDTVLIKDVILDGRDSQLSYHFSKRPVRIDVDPAFNVFRRLDKNEVPASISQISGTQDAVMILPGKSPYLREYTALAEQWKETQKAQGKTLEIRYDTALSELPSRQVWIVGFENKFAPKDVFSNYKDVLPKETLDMAESLSKTGGLVYVFKDSKNPGITNAFLGSNNPKMVDGLKRKVTHYSKYSYIGFSGDDAENKLKGEFPALGSPMTYYIKYDGHTLQSPAKLKPRKALAD